MTENRLTNYNFYIILWTENNNIRYKLAEVPIYIG